MLISGDTQAEICRQAKIKPAEISQRSGDLHAVNRLSDIGDEYKEEKPLDENHPLARDPILA
jgi:hypothetical protein